MGEGKVYIGNLSKRIAERDLEDEFRRFGKLKSVWVARNPPGLFYLNFIFILFCYFIFILYFIEIRIIIFIVVIAL